MHHELSSLIFLNEYGYGTDAFREKYDKAYDLFTSYFDYHGKYDIVDKDTLNPDDKLFFCNSVYSKFSFENDYNCISQFLFFPVHIEYEGELYSFYEFLDLAKKNEFPVYEKVMATMELWEAVSDYYRQKFFRSMHEDKLDQFNSKSSNPAY